MIAALYLSYQLNQANDFEYKHKEDSQEINSTNLPDEEPEPHYERIAPLPSYDDEDYDEDDPSNDA